MTKEFEPKYKLIEPSAQILNESVAKFDFANPPVDPFELSQELVDRDLEFYKKIQKPEVNNFLKRIFYERYEEQLK